MGYGEKIMSYKEEVRQYATDVLNYNQSVVDAFDDRDCDIIIGTLGFKRWRVDRELEALQERLLSMSFLKFITIKIKRMFR